MPDIYNINSGASVGFLSGTQASINTMLGQGTAAGAIEGHFYLAADTHRLYIGNNDHSISPVNEGITTVANRTALNAITPSESSTTAWRALQGQFYYIQDENILCVASGNRWVQINPDTYLIGSSQADTNSLANGGGLDTGMIYAEAASGQTNTALIKARVQDTTGQLGAGNAPIPVHTVGGNFKIAGGSNITVSVNSTTNTITLDAPDGAKYDLTMEKPANTTHQVDLVLTQRGTGGEVDRVSIYEGDSVYPDIENGKLVFKGGGLVGMTANVGINDTTHVFTITLDNGLDQVPIEFIPAIEVGTGANKTTKYFSFTPGQNGAPGTASIDLGIYSKDEIDNMFATELNALDAMYFAGTLGTGGTYGSLTALKNGTTSLKSGATFKVISPIESSTVPSGMTIDGWPIANVDTTMEIGDMIVVTGTETNGVISSNAKYTYIPSGNDEDIYYTPNFKDHDKEAWFTNSADTNEIHKLKFAAGSSSKVSVVGSVSGNDQTITVDHVAITAPTVPTPTATITQSSTNESPEFTAITGLTFDGYGHVTNYETKKLQLWSNHLNQVLSQASVSSSTTSGITTYVSKIANTYYDADGQYQLYNGSAGSGNADVNDWELVSDTLKIEVGNAGSASAAARLNVNMVWGSFAASV